ncbi:MAG: class I SAM-dependent methyltransferase [Actinomycetota bacterium]
MGMQTTTAYEKYAGNPPPVNYERYFVPDIGLPSARPLLGAAALRKGQEVLDVACGTGVAARLAAEIVGPTGSVSGVDVNPGMLQVAREVSPPGTSIDWTHASADDLPLPDGSFDVVICSLGFQFFEDKIGALKEARRVLKPGGRVVLGTPGPTPPLFQVIDEVLTRYAGPEASKFVQVVFSVHDPEKVQAMLEAAGFKDVHAESRSLEFRMSPPADFFWQYVHGTPLAAVAAKMDPETRVLLERDVVERCLPFVDGDGLLMETDLLVATARRGPDDR